MVDNDKKMSGVDVEINGITVKFPFEPYKVQTDFMTNVIECLQKKQHGVLESPTGTGKTLSLLCSTLSWQTVKKAQVQAQALAGAAAASDSGGQFFEKLKDGLDSAAGPSSQTQQSSQFGWAMPKIIYASRTHSQLSQAMQELKRTAYKHVKVAVLGSRDQMCIHPEISKVENSSDKINMCQAKVRARQCHYYNNVELKINEPEFKQEICDIEDLVKIGTKLKCCPYFMSRELKQHADITFMPYNYLLDPKTRKSQGIDLRDAVVLLDEAHNVERTCEDAASLQISSTDVALCIDDITAVMMDVSEEKIGQTDFSMEGNDSVQKDFTPEDLCALKEMFLALERAIDDITLENSQKSKTLPGGFMFELLEKANLTHGRDTWAVDKLMKIGLYLSTTSASPFTRKGRSLQQFIDLLRTVFSGGTNDQRHKERVAKCYKVHVQVDQPTKPGKSDGWETKKKSVKKAGGKLISYWCFNPGFGMQQLVEQGAHSIILTSGTLTPLNPFISELGIPIAVQLQNPHIIDAKQVLVGVLSRGPDGTVLNSSFNTRDNPQYIASLGRTIHNFSCLIPDGLLVFFPSYPVMRKCRDEWMRSGQWASIEQKKTIFVEPQSKIEFNAAMNGFYEKIQDPSFRGAIFMGVCRGKVSEGMDFANANGRAVIITGLPYPPFTEPRIVLKKEYLDENRVKDKTGITGQQWYSLQATRAVNQAIGRIIRHRYDYGAIIFVDCRFETNLGGLPAWLRPLVRLYNNFGAVAKELGQFFRYARESLPQTEMRPLRSVSDDSLPAVPARFESADVKQLETGSLGIGSAKAKEEEVIDIKAYEVAKDTNGSTKRKLINFSECKDKVPWTKCALTEETTEPSGKRRKVKILPVEFNNNVSIPSTSADSAVRPNELWASDSAKKPASDESSDSAKKPASDESSDSAKKPAIDESSDSAKKPATDKPKEAGKSYLKDVKRTLSADRFKTFAAMIQKYSKDRDFAELMRSIKIVFPDGEDYQHLREGFRSFVHKDHIEMFNRDITPFD